MFEAPTEARIRDAYRAGHQARSDALREFLRWMTRR